jgi:peptidoglycan-associated lipoprotein
MNVLNMKSRISVLVRMYLVVGVAALAGLGCPKGRRPVVSGPGGAQGTAGGRGAGGAGDQGGDGVAGMPRTTGGGTDLENEMSGPLENILFEYDSAALTAKAMDMLQSHALWIKDHPGSQITLEGHCDERGTAEYNMSLGESRARAVYDYLTSLGVPGARLTTVSFGKERPLDTSSNEAAWAKNRRVHFAVP